MNQVLYHSTNNPEEKVNFETALLNGMASNYGLYMMARRDIPRLSPEQIRDMKHMSYADISFQVLNPYLNAEISQDKLKELLDDAYSEDKIPTKVQHVTGRSHIMWLTQGPTYSFKDYAARFFGRTLNHFLGERGLRRVVVVATSGDTGGAVADALYGLDKVDNVVFFPKGEISERQRRQMTTLGRNIHAFEVNGNFDLCQALAKNLLGDKKYAEEVFDDEERLTSANSISIGRLLPQSVYPFFAYSRIAENGEPMIASVPSGNFGDMMGTMLAKEMGLPISKILCGVNENKEFPEFLETGKYTVKPAKKSPSSAMNVSHPSNLARLIDFYDGHMFDERDPATKKVIRQGVIDRMPDLDAMRRDLFSFSVSDAEHHVAIQKAHHLYDVMLDPHGAVGWRVLEEFLKSKHDQLSVVYETADPGKFPNDILLSIGITPPVPEGIARQAELEERIYSIESEPEHTEEDLKKLSDAQIKEAKQKIREIFS